MKETNADGLAVLTLSVSLRTCVGNLFFERIALSLHETVCLTFGVLKAQHRALAEVDAQMMDVDDPGWQANFTAQLLNYIEVVTHAVGLTIRDFPHEFTAQRFHRMLGVRLLGS